MALEAIVCRFCSCCYKHDRITWEDRPAHMGTSNSTGNRRSCRCNHCKVSAQLCLCHMPLSLDCYAANTAPCTRSQCHFLDQHHSVSQTHSSYLWTMEVFHHYDLVVTTYYSRLHHCNNFILAPASRSISSTPPASFTDRCRCLSAARLKPSVSLSPWTLRRSCACSDASTGLAAGAAVSCP